MAAPETHEVHETQVTASAHPTPATAPASRPDTASLRRLAVEFGVDPRSILRELREPGSVKGMAGERARAAATAWKHGREAGRQ